MSRSVVASTSVSTVRAWLSALAALTAGALLALGMTVPAQAAVAATSLKVTVSAAGSPDSGVETTLYYFNASYGDWETVDGPGYGGGSGDQPDHGVTGTNGVVTYVGLLAGTKYAIQFDATSADTPAAGGFEIARTTSTAPDFSAASATTGTYLTTTAGVNSTAVSLSEGVAVTGNILQSNGDPDTNANEIEAFRQTVTPDNGTDWSYVGDAQIDSDTNSDYSISNLAPGNYAFRAEQDADSSIAAYTFNDGASSAASADPTVVGSSDTTQDITFVTGDTLSGTIAMQDASNPDVSVDVIPVDASGDDISGDDNPVYNTQTNTDAGDGSYSVVVPSGYYKIDFQPSDSDFYEGWYNNAADEDHASIVHVTGNTTLDSNTLGSGFSISGSVSIDGQDSGAASGFTVTATNTLAANDPEDYTPVVTTVGDQGTYTLVGLAPGSYTVDVAGTSDAYPDTFYTGTTTPYGSSSSYFAKVISGTSQTVTGANVDFHPSSTLTVNVSTATGAPATGLDVFAEPMKGGQQDFSASANSEDASPVAGHPGSYSFSGSSTLSQGVTYAIGFSSTGDPSVDVQYLGGGDDPQDSNLYTASTASSTISVSLRATSALTGVVTSSAGKVIADAGVNLYVFDGTSWVDAGLQTFTNAKGAYSFANLPTGSYKAEFFSLYGSINYLTGYSGSATTLDAATSVYVSPGHPGVLSAKLAVAGSITGTIAGGALAGSVIVLPVALTGTPGNFTKAEVQSIEPTVSSVGKFTMTGLASGYYALTFYDFGDHFGNSYSGMNSPSTLVYKVTAGVATAAGTITLPLASVTPVVQPTVSGQLTGATLGTADGQISFSTPDGPLGTEAEFNDNGSYSVQLAPGTYTWTVSVSDDDDPSALLSEPSGSITVTTAGATLDPEVDALSALAFTQPASIDTTNTTVGTTYTVGSVAFNRPTSTDEPVTVAYQWYRGTPDGKHLAIFGAKSATYTSQGGDFGAQLYATVTISDGPGINDVSTAEAVSETVAVNLGDSGVTASSQLSNTAQPTIDSSTGKVGVALHANPGAWNGITGATYSYVWTSTRTSGTVVVGTNSPTYIPDAADGGASISVTVSASKIGYTTPDAAPSSNTAAIVVLGAPTVTVVPKITSKAGTAATLGDTIYTATPGTWSVAGAYTYEWYVNGTATASGPAFTVDPNVVAPTSAIALTVTDSPIGYTPVTSSAYMARLDTTVGTAEDSGPYVTDTTNANTTIDDDSAVPFGDVLQANVAQSILYGDTNTQPTVFSYQWQRRTGTTWANIALATKATYTVGTADATHALRVNITYSSPTNAAKVWAPVAAGTGVINTALTSSSATITFAPTDVYAPLTPVATTVSSTWGTTIGVTNTYQWYICDTNCDTFAATGGTVDNGYTPIAKATTTSYTPTALQDGKDFVLRVTGTKVGYATGYTSSEPFEAHKSEALENTPASVTLTGTGAALTKLTGTASAAWGAVTGVTDTYQWYSCSTDCDSSTSDNTIPNGFTAIAKATTSSYTPTLAQAGVHLVLVVTGNKVGYFTGYAVSDEKVVTAVITALTPPSFSTATFGVKITAKAPTFDVATPTLKYVWQTSTDGTTWVNAAGVNGALTYTPVLGDFASANEQLRLEVSATKAGYNVGDGVTAATVTDSASLTLVKANPVPTVKPTVVATATALTIKPGTWPTAGGAGTPSYEWRVDGDPAVDSDGNQVGNTPTIARPTAGHAVTVTETWPGGAAYNDATYPLVAQKGTAWVPLATGGGTIEGTPQFGQGALSGTADSFTDLFTLPGEDADSLVHTDPAPQWYFGTTVATTAIPGATSFSYTPTTAYIGKKLFLRYTVVSPDYATSVYTTPGVLFTAGAGAHGSPTITTATTVHPGASLAVNLGIQLLGTTHGYQWLYEAPGASTFTPIVGATKATYLVTAAQLGGSLEVSVTNIRAGYLTVSDTTAASLVVQPSALAPITQPTVSGSNAAGSVLTATPGSWNVSGTTFTYRWFRNGVALPGVTTATYTLTGEDSGDEVRAEVTGHAAGYDAVAVATNTIAATDGAAAKATVVPKVTGSASMGSTLTATTGTWSLDGLTFTYQWWRQPATGTATKIDGATSSTYVLGSSDASSKVYVVVTATRAGFQDGTSTSASTAAVVGAP